MCDVPYSVYWGQNKGIEIFIVMKSLYLKQMFHVEKVQKTQVITFKLWFNW